MNDFGYFESLMKNFKQVNDTQQENIEKAAELMADAIANDRLINVYGGGGHTTLCIMVMQNDNVLNAIATTEDGIVCTIEISATLKAGEIPKDKHEIISQRGIACDVVVDAQLKQDSIYVFGSENKKYTDVDFELYGLSIEETAIVRAAFALARNKNYDEVKAIDANLSKLVELAKTSAKTGKREVM